MFGNLTNFDQKGVFNGHELPYKSALFQQFFYHLIILNLKIFIAARRKWLLYTSFSRCFFLPIEFSTGSQMTMLKVKNQMCAKLLPKEQLAMMMMMTIAGNFYLYTSALFRSLFYFMFEMQLIAKFVLVLSD